ncbi:MAG: hypothetical protein OXI51_08550 [Chloroflexota bacterium]|nr:hypothetical protein [Chloroflexota bacterium]
MDVPSTVSVIIGAVAVAVSIFALWLAWLAARESRENFQKTRDTLAQIDKSATVTEKILAENQRELLDTVKRLAIPEKSEADEQMGVELTKALMHLFTGGLTAGGSPELPQQQSDQDEESN